jgi:hypothetical protein
MWPAKQEWGLWQASEPAPNGDYLTDRLVLAAPRPQVAPIFSRHEWTEGMVEMGESRTPRPEPFGRDHYERVRSFSSTVGARIGTLTVGPVTCL